MTDRLADVLKRARKSGGPCFSHFLSPADGREFLGAARNAGLSGEGNGLCDDAERAVCGIWSDGYGPPDAWPIEALSITWAKLAGAPGHRDLLGALLGLGIDRERVGDLRVGEGSAWVAVESGIAGFVRANLIQAGRVSVRVESAGTPPERERGQEGSINVQSLRLDAVLAAALRLSRARAQEAVRAGKVALNWREELRPDREVACGDTLSVRGCGRVKVGEVSGLSKKGRMYVSVETHLEK